MDLGVPSQESRKKNNRKLARDNLPESIDEDDVPA